MMTTMTEGQPGPPQASQGTTPSNGRRSHRRRRGGRGRGGGGVQDSDRLGPPAQILHNKVGDGDGQTSNGGSRRRNNRRGRGGRGRGGNVNGGGDNVTAILQRGDAQAPTNNTASDPPANQSTQSTPPSPRTEQAMQFIADSITTTTAGDAANANHTAQTGTKLQQQNNGDMKKKKKRKPKKKKQQHNPKSAPWRKYIIPNDLEDPISLEPLVKLPYPPFAIVVDEPYIPVLPGMWPSELTENTGDEQTAENGNSKAKSATTTAAIGSNGGNEKEDRELEILKQQWGDQSVAISAAARQKKNVDESNDVRENAKNDSIHGRHVNLFDGRVLAYYLVSTLQFIDPYNRRDLTRSELQALDAYLAHHNLGNAGVVAAYDDKGVTLSTAGRAAQSAAGRVEILQQEARAILNSLHQGGRGGGGGQRRQQQQQSTRSRQRQHQRDGRDIDEGTILTNSFQQMYAAQQGGGSGSQPLLQHNQPGRAALNHDTGIYEGEGGGGLLIIDDDINPGLRSGVPFDGSNADGTTSLYSARHIAEQHSHAAQLQETNFPSLSSNAPADISQGARNNDVDADTSTKPPPGPSSKSLKKISKLVKPTDPLEVEKQRKAREEATRRAELSKLSYFNPDDRRLDATPGGALPTISAGATLKQPPSEAVLERNRNLAQALGVSPSTIRNEAALTGWARPTSGNTTDEFSKELNAAQYPDALLVEAKERMSELLKLEKQWRRFLGDDKEASCSLKPMARPLRKFVHEYSDFWKLHTESFDPEGRRYIYCKKKDDTCAPYPLLSEAARKWKGPTVGPASEEVDIASLPTGPSASNATEVTDGWRTEQRVPLKLAPRTLAEGASQPPMPKSSIGGMTRSTSTPLLSMTGERPPPPRFADLHEKERPRIQIAKRSIPTWDELEKRSITQAEWNEMTTEQQDDVIREIEEEEAKRQVQLQREKEKDIARAQRAETKAKKKRDDQVKKEALLANAFASSSDDDDGSSGSDWFEDDLAEFDDDEGM